jgi:UDP-2,3-diacylglucosamine hydrolase
MAGPAQEAEALYILGDLFEYWAGDDDIEDPLNARVASLLAAYTEAGHDLFFAPGNRDFLIGAAFLAKTNMQYLPDPTFCQILGKDYVLSHGDAWCTDDVAYQAFRAMVRVPEWQKAFFLRSLPERKAIIENVRIQSEQSKEMRGEGIMDVNPDAIAQVIAQYPGASLIHGHTHRPGCIAHSGPQGLTQRWVLPDWRENEVAYLALDSQGPRYERFWPS